MIRLDSATGDYCVTGLCLRLGDTKLQFANLVSRDFRAGEFVALDPHSSVFEALGKFLQLRKRCRQLRQFNPCWPFDHVCHRLLAFLFKGRKQKTEQALVRFRFC